jgi:pyruvate dehydrogenase E1 component alpha subunit
MTFVSIYRLPVIFLCYNKGYAVYTPTVSLSHGALERRAEIYGFPGVAVDGTDPPLVNAAVADATGRARGGGGPTLVVATARRLAGHHTHDPEHYRPAGEKAAWAAEWDPITKVRRAILEERLADEAELRHVDADARAEVRAAATAAAEGPASDPATLERHVYA